MLRSSAAVFSSSAAVFSRSARVRSSTSAPSGSACSRARRFRRRRRHRCAVRKVAAREQHRVVSELRAAAARSARPATRPAPRRASSDSVPNTSVSTRLVRAPDNAASAGMPTNTCHGTRPARVYPAMRSIVVERRAFRRRPRGSRCARLALPTFSTLMPIQCSGSMLRASTTPSALTIDTTVSGGRGALQVEQPLQVAQLRRYRHDADHAIVGAEYRARERRRPTRRCRGM